jgi:PAS domain S-box-containing protein
VASVLLLGCPEAYAAALPHGAQAVAANEFGEPRVSPEPDLVVIGPARSDASLLAQRVGRAFPKVDVLIAAPSSEMPRLKDLLRISPYIPLRTDLVSSESEEVVEQALRAAVARCDLRKGHRAVLESVRQAVATAAGSSGSWPSAAAGPAQQSAVSDPEPLRRRRFFQLYQHIRHEVLHEVAHATPHLSAAAPVLRAALTANARERELAMAQLERAALLDEDWEPYVTALHEAGRAHAELGLSFGQWLEVSHQFRRSVLGRFAHQQGSDSGYMADVVLGMESFLRVSLCEIERAHTAAQRALMQRLEANARLFAAAVEASDAAIFTASLDNTITAYNPAAERMLGCRNGEVLGRPLSDLAREDQRGTLVAQLAEAARGIPMRGLESSWCTPEGRELVVSLIVSPVKTPEGRAVGLSIVAQDITAQKRTEESLRQTQKMEAVGRLAGGVAHDFNNLLTVIMSHASLMSEPEAQAPDPEALSEILQAAERARALTQQLLSFSRGQPAQPARIDVNEAVRSTHRLLRRTLAESIEIAVLPHEELWPVWMDGSQLEQLLMNLALNALDAMPGGGKLGIELENERLADPSGALAAGDYVRLRVSDTGIGMAPEVLSHVFEPFFTTKSAGKGSGVGLATCHGIVRRAGGDIRVASELGRGSTFSVWLPRAAQSERLAAPPLRSPAAGSLSGCETILVVEDDPAVRAAAALALQKHGYRVLQAQNGDEALRLIERDENIALVLSDVVMPQMSGPELAAHLAQTRPDLPLLFMSGYAEDRLLGQGALSRAAIISKPFLPSDLARKVRQVLDAARGGALGAPDGAVQITVSSGMMPDLGTITMPSRMKK